MRKLLKKYFTYIYNIERFERRNIQERLMEYNPQAIVLDCGCREGITTVRMASRVGTSHIIGLDYTLRVLQEAATRGIMPLRSDLNRSIPLCSNSVDVIFASDVLEHLINPAVFVAELFRVLRPGGYLILDTPNLASWHNVFALFLGIQPFSGPNITNMEDGEIALVREMHRADHGLSEEGENILHNEQELTRHIVVVAYNSLLNLLHKIGFRIVVKRGFGYYPFPPIIARLLQCVDPAHAHHILIKAVKPL